MRLKLIVGISSIVLILISMLGIAFNKIEKLKAEKVRLSGNQETLLVENKSYRTKDSLSVLSVKQLNFTNKELRSYRASDLELIKTLRIDNKRLAQISTTQIETIYIFETDIKDSVIYENSIPVDTLKSLQYKDTWMEFNGVVDSYGGFNGSIVSKDSIMYVEHIIPKRFLFFKWGIKERKQEIISKNPHTTILNAEFITIKD